MKPTKIFLVLFFAFSVGLFAQQKEDYSKEPGYFDFTELVKIKNAVPTTEVYLEEPLLKMVGKLAQDKNGGAGDMIGALKLVRVNEFNIDKDNLSAAENTIESMDKTLLAKKWDRIIRTKHKGSFANVYVKHGQNDEFVGLTIMSLDGGDKLTLVNIVGKIDLNTIGKLSEQLHVPGLDKAKKEK